MQNIANRGQLDISLLMLETRMSFPYGTSLTGHPKPFVIVVSNNVFMFLSDEIVTHCEYCDMMYQCISDVSLTFFLSTLNTCCAAEACLKWFEICIHLCYVPNTRLISFHIGVVILLSY